MKNVETKGIVLSSNPYREKDRVVKIETKDFGKRLFFIKNSERSKISALLQSFTRADFLVTINDNGFSFINDVSQVQTFLELTKDIEIEAYAGYVVSLVDLASEEEADPPLYDFLVKILEMMNEGFDKQILTNIFELQLLPRFGASPNLSECAICGRSDLPLNFSFLYNGCLCQDHFSKDPRRLPISANIIYFANQLMQLSLENLESIEVKENTKDQLRKFIDALYDEYVGFQTKAKKFLDSMKKWNIR